MIGRHPSATTEWQLAIGCPSCAKGGGDLGNHALALFYFIIYFGSNVLPVLGAVSRNNMIKKQLFLK